MDGFLPRASWVEHLCTGSPGVGQEAPGPPRHSLYPFWLLRRGWGRRCNCTDDRGGLVWFGLFPLQQRWRVAQWSETSRSPTFMCFTHWLFLFVFKLIQQIPFEQNVPLLNKCLFTYIYLYTCMHTYIYTYMYLKCLQSESDIFIIKMKDISL